MNIQEQLNSLIRGNPLSVDTYLREVCKNEHISDTKASMHIYMLKLDGNNRPRTCDFCDYLINRIVDYCIPPSEIRKAKEKDAEYNTTQYTATLFRKAERLFTDLGNTGEVGELALSVLTQSFLHMPQVLCKMVLKTNSEVHYHGADGVYGKYDTETQKYCLYWGEAKIYADVRQALSSCFDAYTYFLAAYYKYGRVSNSYMSELYGKSLCKEIDEALESALSNVEVPATILSKNQGVNPLAQQKLLEYFKKFERDSIELIPPYPEDDDAQEKYLHIIGRISSNLTGDSYKLNAYRSVLITNWLRGYGLARIIADNIRWHNKNKTGKNTATIIRETMRDIEEYARFRFLKYTTCYIDVLKLYLGTKGDCAAIDKIPQLNLWLEFGASKTTQISLMAMGFTRTAALEFSDLIVDENYNKEQCLHWFQTNNINAMDLPASIINEAGRIIKLQ